jgi:tetratricopeptide (TPR) repeat protein
MQLDRKNDVPPLEGDDLHKAIEEQGLEFFRQFIDENNPDRDVRFQSARAYWLMATVYCARMDADQAQAMMRKEFAVLERLIADFPEDALYRKELLRAHYLLGVLLTSLKKPQEARPEFEHTAELHRLAVQIDDSATARNAYAWFLVDCPDPALRDASRAVALATEATTMEPHDGRFWNTLGVALYRAGNWSAATAALEKSMALRNPDPYDWFFLAMACGQRGEFTQARVWLDRATQSIDMKKPPEDFNRYYTEASALLKEP